MMMEKLLLILITLSLQVHDIRGQSAQLRQKRSNGASSFQLKLLENWAVSMQAEQAEIKTRLNVLDRFSTEITSRIDGLDRFSTEITSRIDGLETVSTKIAEITSGLDRFERVSNKIEEITSRLDRFEGVSTEMAEFKIQLDEFQKVSNMVVQRPAYDEELVKRYISEVMSKTLDTIQDGLANEKQQHIRLEYMTVENKDWINNQIELFQKKTGLLENRTEENKDLIKHQIELFQKKTGLLENRTEENKDLIKHQIELFQKKTGLLENRTEENKDLIKHQIELFQKKTGLLENRTEENKDLIKHQIELFQKKTGLLENRTEENKDLIKHQIELFQKKTGLLENRTEENKDLIKHQNELFQKKTELLENRIETHITGYKAKDCWDLKSIYGISEDGVYDVLSPDGQKMRLRCDMTTDGGGWTIVQRRGDGSVRFNNTYTEYKSFFGNLTGEFWMGNDFLNVFTRGVRQTLRVDICNWDNEAKWAKYKHFSVGPSADKYRLGVEDYSGTAGDTLITGYEGRSGYSHNGEAFSAPGGDHDNWGEGECASLAQSGWWFNRCGSANLNGLYRPETSSGSTRYGIQWWTWILKHSFKGSEMKIRPSTSSTSSSTNKPFTCPVI